jgi:hypothetical protein
LAGVISKNDTVFGGDLHVGVKTAQLKIREPHVITVTDSVL